MSFVTPAEPKPRPSTVSMAVYLLYLVAGVEILGAILTLSTFGKTRDIYLDAYRGTPDEDTIKTVMTVTPIVTVIFAALFAGGFIVLGILNGKGKQPARIVTWVLGGLAVLCLSCGTFFTGRGMGSARDGGPDPDEVRRRAEAALPSWQAPVSVTLTVLSVLALLVVIVLLALPASNPFFAKEQQVWVPPTEWSGPPGSELPPPPPPPAPPSGGPGGGAPPPLQ